jgi:hypothetical protein
MEAQSVRQVLSLISQDLLLLRVVIVVFRAIWRRFLKFLHPLYVFILFRAGEKRNWAIDGGFTVANELFDLCLFIAYDTIRDTISEEVDRLGTR